MARRLEALPEVMNINIDSNMFNEVYLHHVRTVYSREVYYGGAGSGKSFFVSQKLALQMTLMEGRNLVCLRQQKTDCIASCWADIKGALSEFGLLQYWELKENPNHMMQHRVNGNQILFEGVDNIEDIKSIKFYNKARNKRGNLTDVWYEEANAEPTIATVREIERRLRDRFVKNRIVLSFNPVSRSHWLFHYVTVELADNKDALILKTTYKDNKFNPEEYKRTLENYKFTSPYDYQVYTLGNWGTMGETVFDANKIQSRLERLEEITIYGFDFLYIKDAIGNPVTESYRLIPNTDGDIRIFKEPQRKVPYVLGIDTSGEGSDYYAGHVMNNITGEQVARFKSLRKPDECVWQLYGLAIYYNFALVCPEINFDSWIIKALTMMDYPNIYRRVSENTKTHIKNEDRYGWRTQVDNRQAMLTDMVYWCKENIDCINDVDTLNEMLTFTRQDRRLKGIWWGAEQGEHDDLVMSFSITLQARVQQSCEMIPDFVKIEGFWMREEIEMALMDGRIDIQQAMEYKLSNGYYCENEEKRERRNKYVSR